MRQIQLGACLILLGCLLPACGGEEFSSGDSPADESLLPNGESGNRSSGSGDSASGSSQPGTSSKAGSSGSGGSSPPNSGGASSGGTGATAMAGAGPSSGGAEGEGGAECVPVSVHFKMLPGPELPQNYLCDAGCGTGWLTITDADGAMAYSIFSACGTASCESCELLPCAAAACLPTPLTAQGSELTWTGTYMEQDTCGEDMACQRPTCAPPGKYRAKACASVSAGSAGVEGSCTPKDTAMLCTEMEFELPGTEEVRLILQK